ncbi:MAG: hypothetical protein ACTSU5_10530 [Promethearchaeota archaeon]
MSSQSKVEDLLLSIRGTRDEGNLVVLADSVGPSAVLFTLYGRVVEEFLATLVPIRAIDQKGVADEITRRVMNALFRPETKPEFNASISVWRDVIVSRVRELFEGRMSDADIERELAAHAEDYYNFEIDGVVYLAVKAPREKLVEVKLFTAPKEDEGRVLRGHLRDGALVRYFVVRDYLGLMGFSYLRRGDEDDPLPGVASGAGVPGVRGTWAVHFAFYDASILDDGEKAPGRARALLEAIRGHQARLASHFLPEGEDLNFRLTYNLVKVFLLAQVIAEWQQKYNRERERAEEEARRAEEEARRAEEEARRAEEEARRAEKYAKKLRELGVDPDEL